MQHDFARTAALLSDPARASMLMALLGGVALPAGQLALIANVAPQTASSHLAKLMAGDLLCVEQQGRHRYYRLAGAEVGVAIEALLAISPQYSSPADSHDSRRPQAIVGSIAYARTCYSHLAGQLAVSIARALEKQRFLVAIEPRCYRVTGGGRDWFQRLGISIRERDARDPRFARRCLDWTERRHHLAGRLGSAFLNRLRELNWIAPVRGGRAVRITLHGRQNLEDLLGSSVAGLIA